MAFNIQLLFYVAVVIILFSLLFSFTVYNIFLYYYFSFSCILFLFCILTEGSVCFICMCWKLILSKSLFTSTGEPGKLIRERYRTASQVVQNQVRSFSILTVDICMSRAMNFNIVNVVYYALFLFLVFIIVFFDHLSIGLHIKLIIV